MADKEAAGAADEPTPADDHLDAETSDDSKVSGSNSDEVDNESDGSEATESNSEADDRVPVTVGAEPASATKKASAAGGPRSEPEAKGRPTRKRDGKAPTQRRTGPVTFVKESVTELRKVVYPTGEQLLKYFVVVLIFVLFVIAYVSLLDLGFGAAMLWIFG